MQSHLAVSYASQSVSGGTKSSGTAPSRTDTDHNPLGFLAALTDRLTGRGSQDEGGSTASADPASTGSNGLANVKVDASTPATKPTDAKSLLAKLNEELDKLQSELDGGGSPDPELLKKLGETINAIAALLAQNMAPPPPVTPADVGNVAPPPPVSPVGSTAPAPPVTPAVGPPPPPVTPINPAFGDLIAKMERLASAISPLAPRAAEQLHALSGALTTAQTDPTLVAQLTATSGSDGTALDSAAQQLLDARRIPAGPQLAASTELRMPENLVPTPSPTTTSDAVSGPAPVEPQTSPLPAVVLAKSTPDKSDPVADQNTGTDLKIVTTAVADGKSATASDSQAQPAVAGIATTPVIFNAPRVLPAAYQAVSNPINMAQVAFEMVRQVHQGQSRFSLRLDPPELGRVDVRMHVDASGAVNARLTVERSETLDMFQRDRGSLEKALSQAGLDAGKTNLEFSLRQQQNPFAGNFSGDQRQPRQTLAAAAAGTDDSTVAPILTLYRGTASAAGVNLFV